MFGSGKRVGSSDGSRLDLVGIGSMVVDRIHRTPHMLSRGEKTILRGVDSTEPVRRYTGGVVLNHLGWAAALGLRTGIFGRQADDPNGRLLRGAMDRLGIETNLVLDGSASSFAEIFVDDAGERVIYMAPGATSETTAEHVQRDHAAFIGRGARLSTEISQLPLPAVAAALEIARKARIPTVVDFDVPPDEAIGALGDEATLESVLRNATLLKPAKLAAAAVAPEAQGDPVALARALRRRYGNEAVVVTDGEAGSAVSAAGFEGFVPGRPAKALDTTGAGDAFLGGLLAGLHHGLGWEDAARLGNACGAACVEKLGAFPEDVEALRARVLELYRGPALSLGSLPQAASPVAREALDLFEVTGEQIAALRGRSDPAAFDTAVQLIRASNTRGGRLHVTGIGKPEHVARYAASLFSSTGTPATFLHATEAVHGSAGQIVSGDVVIAISNSGQTAELLQTVEALKRLGAVLIAVTGGVESALAQRADLVLDAGVAREGGPLGLAPRASVVAEVLVLAALAAALERECGFTREQYNARHPAGTLGDLSAASSPSRTRERRPRQRTGTAKKPRRTTRRPPAPSP